METTRYEMLVRAKTPLVHTQESIDNAAIFARKKVIQPNGEVAFVPYVSGNSMRHQLREAATWGTLHAAGITNDAAFTAGAVRLLLNGGALTGRGDSAVVNLDSWRRLCAMFPPLALFGGCIDGGPREGKVKVEEMNLLCTERAHTMPAWIQEWMIERQWQLSSGREVVEERQDVRMDSMLTQAGRSLLSAPQLADVEARELLREKAREGGDTKAVKELKSGMLPYTYERLAEGTMLTWAVEARTHSDLEFDAFNFTIACLLNNFRVGGKGGVGHGSLEFVHGARVRFAPIGGAFEAVGAGLAPKTGDMYRAHIADKREELIAWLRTEVNA